MATGEKVVRKPFGADLLRTVPENSGQQEKSKNTRTVRDTYGGGKETDSEDDG
jgi:hypothetical protein